MRPSRLALYAILLASALLRFTGLDWSVDPATGHFHRFHPDESTLLDNTAWLADDLSEIKSAYGLAPVYLLYAAGHISGWVFDFNAFDREDPRSDRLSYLTARGLNAALGTATVFLVFLLGHRAGGTGIGIVSAILLACSPGHIQQCHYYTVDAGLTFWATLSLYLILLTPTNQRWKHLLIGLSVGVAGGYRFIAGFLALPYVAAHIWLPGDRSRSDALGSLGSRIRSLVGLNTLLCGVVALAVTLIAFPTLLLDPTGFFEFGDQRDFVPSMEVATGKALRLWNLYDFTTTPYLFYLTDLLPAALGHIAAASALCGLVACVYRPGRVPTLLLTWAIAYFALTGGLFTKPIRYTAPLLPVLCCLAAYGWRVASQAMATRLGPIASLLLATLICLPTALHGYSVSRTFSRVNVRFEAQAWIHENVPDSAVVMGETGGFPTMWMTEPFRRAKKDPGSLFMRTRHHVLPSNVMDILAETVSVVDYWLLIRQNRAIPYISAPEVYPLASEFYRRLSDGHLGYERIAVMEHPAELLGWRFDNEDTDPTITAFDRPTIEVYRRTPDHERLWGAWRNEVASDDRNPDPLVRKGVSEYRAGEFAAALSTFEQALARFPDLKLAELCRVEAIYRIDRSEVAQKAFEDAQVSMWDFAGLTLAGIPERGADYIRITQDGKPATSENLYLRQIASKAFTQLGMLAKRASKRDDAIAWYKKAIQMSNRYLDPYRSLGLFYLQDGQYDASRDAFREAIRIRRTIDDLWIGLAIAESNLNNPQAAFSAIQEGIRLAPDQTRYTTIYKEVADFLRRSGHGVWADEIESQTQP
jgi:tetratricopeptide (TPR) repeat protein